MLAKKQNVKSAIRQPERNKGKIKLSAKNKAAEGDIDYSLIYESLKEEYSKEKDVVEINFRDLVSFRSGVDRYTHLIHPYPAKLLLNIPYFFLNCSALYKKGGTVFDPFCGTGTVLLESIVNGNDAIGADANPLARLIAKVKTKPLRRNRISEACDEITRYVQDGRTTGARSPQSVIDWEYWYPRKTKEKLEKILFAISKIDDSTLKNFFYVCFSVCARKVSYADPNISVPVRLNAEKFVDNKTTQKKVSKNLSDISTADALAVFRKVVTLNTKRIATLTALKGKGKLKGLCDDARDLSALKSNSIDFIITSPPYAGAQKYIRSSSLSLGWLGLCPENKLRNLEKKNIGREHYTKDEYQNLIHTSVVSAQALLKKVRAKNPLRAHIAANYLLEMKAAFDECYRILKKGSYLVLIVGNNIICEEAFETRKYLTEICEKIGFSCELVLKDDIKSRGLMTKRNKTASMITCEWIIVLRK